MDGSGLPVNKLCHMVDVQIPDTEGRAGMAAIHDPLRSLQLPALSSALRRHLPTFARPLFLRLVGGEGGIEATGTFKLKKFRLQREGFDPAVAVPAGDRVRKQSLDACCNCGTCC